MAETKEDIAAERDALRAENDTLRAQLADLSATAAERDALRAENDTLRAQLADLSATAAAGTAAAPVHRFQLSEGDRQELAIQGAINVGGRMRTADEVRKMLDDDQRDVDLGDAPVPALPERRPAGNTPGVDFIIDRG